MATASLVLAGVGALAANGCDGTCVSMADPNPDTDPTARLPSAFLWVGPKDIAPPCPPGAPDLLFEAYADLTAAPHTCPACACAPSTTTCTDPTGWDAVDASCDGVGGATQTPFDAPASWNGICSTTTKIQADKTCAGGIPCVQSVVVQPPQAVGEPCAPTTVGEGTKPEPAWMTFARGCQQDLNTPVNCGEEPKSKGSYRECKRLENPTDECPTDWDDRHELFQTATDERACSPCTCGPPSGGTCTVKVGAFNDEACELPAGSAYASSDGPAICFDVPDGAALLGKTAETASSSPGSCASAGGEPMGQLVPAEQVTWCCYVPTE